MIHLLLPPRCRRLAVERLRRHLHRRPSRRRGLLLRWSEQEPLFRKVPVLFFLFLRLQVGSSVDRNLALALLYTRTCPRTPRFRWDTETPRNPSMT